MECERCNKELFLSLLLAGNAALIYNWKYGKEYEVYPCPVDGTIWHLSAQSWRRRKAAEALKSAACDQGQS